VGDFVLPTDIDLKAYQRLFVRRVVTEEVLVPDRVLEIGPGPATDLVDNLPAHEYWVVDPRPQWSRQGVRIVRGEVEDAPLPTNYFDVVCSVSVLEHIGHLRWQAVANSIRSSLRPGGIAVHCVDAKCLGRAGDQYGYMQRWPEFFLNAGLELLHPSTELPSSSDVYRDPGVWSMSENAWRQWWATPGQRWEDVGRPVSINMVFRKPRVTPLRRHLFLLNSWLQSRGLPIIG